MFPIGQAVLLASLPLLGLALVGPFSRLRPQAAMIVALLAVAGGLGLGLLLPTDLWRLPDLVGLRTEVLLLLAWGLYGGLASLAGGLRLPGPPLVGAFLAGASMGELGAAAALAGAARDRAGAARLALAAMGGAMVGRVGDPAVLALAGRVDSRTWALVPLGLAMALVAAPRREHLREHPPGSAPVTAVTALVALAAVAFPAWALVALGLGILALAGIAIAARLRGGARDPEALARVLAPSLWTLGSVVLALVATAGGLPHVGAEGLALVVDQVGPVLMPVGTLGAALLAALLDGPAAGLLLAAFVDRAVWFRGDGLALVVMTGAAVGGLGPLVVVGGLRAGLWRWAVQVALAVVWAWVVTS